MAVKTIGAFEAKTHFSKLLEGAQRGEVVRITRHGKPVAELRPIAKAKVRPKPGLFGGKIELGPDFDAPLDDLSEYMK